MVNMLVTSIVFNRLSGQEPDEAVRNAAVGMLVGNATAGIGNPVARAVVGAELRGALEGRTVTDEDRQETALTAAVGHAVAGVVDDPVARDVVVDAVMRGRKSAAEARLPAASASPPKTSSAAVDNAISTLHATDSSSGLRAAGATLGHVAASADDAAQARALTALRQAADRAWMAYSLGTFPGAVDVIARGASPSIQAQARGVLLGWTSGWSDATHRAAAATALGAL